MFHIGLFEMLIVLAVFSVFVAVIVTVVKSASSSSRRFDFNRIVQLEEESSAVAETTSEARGFGGWRCARRRSEFIPRSG